MDLSNIKEEDLVLLSDCVSGLHLLHIENDSNSKPIHILKHYTMLMHMPTQMHIVLQTENDMDSYKLNKSLLQKGQLN